MTDSASTSRPELFRHFATPSGVALSTAGVGLVVADAERYAAFFRDLDSGALTDLKKAIANPQSSDALKKIDQLLTKLLDSHFPGSNAGTPDVDAYVAAVEAFARDRLPVDQDRLARVQGGGDDVSHHRMDDPSMWFKWAAAVDCAAMLEGANGMTPRRTLYLGAAAFGSAMDCVFRARGKTRPEYHADAATETLLRTQARSWVLDGELARTQVRELYRVFIT